MIRKIHSRMGKAALAACAAAFIGCAANVNDGAGGGFQKENGSGGKAGGAIFNAEAIIRAQEPDGVDASVREGYSIVKTASSFDRAQFAALNAEIVSEAAMQDGYTYFLVRTESDARAFREKVRALEGALYAQPDYYSPAPAFTEDDTDYGNNYRRARAEDAVVTPFGTQQGNLNEDPGALKLDWGLTAAHALEAFAEYDAHDAVHPVIAAIVDTGVNTLHEDFFDADGKSIVWFQKSSLHRGSAQKYKPHIVVPPNENWDDVGHGTHCTGTIAAVGNNNKGICGVSHANTKIISYRGLGSSGGTEYSTYSCLGDLADIIAELRKELSERNVEVFRGLPEEVKQSPKLTQATVPVNISLGGYIMAPYEVEMMNKALAAGVLPVIAMGNNGKTLSSFPAALQGVLAVGATTMYDTRAGFSNGGSWMSVCAPGESIYSVGNGGNNWSNYASDDVKKTYRWLSGTSMATPFVTGTIAYLLSINPNLTGYQLKTILERTADKIDKGSIYGRYDSRGYSKWYGYGRVNVLNAAKAVKENSVPAVGSVYCENPVKIAVKKHGNPSMRIWVYEAKSGVCAACAATNATGVVDLYGLRTDTDYEIGVNAEGVYYSHRLKPSNTSAVQYTFDIDDGH
ncbi:MAG: dentilisin complex serine proteinase subunit PrtP [Treponema sp.]